MESDPDDLEVLGTYARMVLAEGRDTSDDYAALVDALGRRGLLHERERLA